MEGFDAIGRGALPLASASIALGPARFDVTAVALAHKGQDALLVQHGFAAVADGSTPLSPGEDAEVARFARLALGELHRSRSLPVRQQFHRAIGAVARGFQVTDPPTCAIGVVQARGADIEVAVLADVLVVVEQTGGTYTALRDDRVAAWDRMMSALIGGLMAQGHTFEEARAHANVLLEYQFANGRNRTGGYWVFGSERAAASEVQAIRVPAATVESILICSDGFSRLADTFGVVAGPEALLQACRLRSVNALGERLRAAERAAGNLVAHPRATVHDDATAVLLTRTKRA